MARILTWRKCLLLMVPILALLLTAFVLRPKHRVTRQNFEVIRAGMTLDKVETVLGPPGDYRTAEVDLDLSKDDGEFFNVMNAPEVLLGERRFRHEWWRGNEGNIWVCFDEEDRVVAKSFIPGQAGTRLWLVRVRTWSGF
jgi:hypothetical protein